MSSEYFYIVCLALFAMAPRSGESAMIECLETRNIGANVPHDLYCDAYYECRLYTSNEGAHVVPLTRYCSGSLLFSRWMERCVPSYLHDCRSN